MEVHKCPATIKVLCHYCGSCHRYVRTGLLSRVQRRESDYRGAEGPYNYTGHAQAMGGLGLVAGAGTQLQLDAAVSDSMVSTTESPGSTLPQLNFEKCRRYAASWFSLSARSLSIARAPIVKCARAVTRRHPTYPTGSTCGHSLDISRPAVTEHGHASEPASWKVGDSEHAEANREPPSMVCSEYYGMDLQDEPHPRQWLWRSQAGALSCSNVNV
jgi:hypothetical protein